MTVRGEVNLSRVGELFADRARSRILMALHSGKELPASTLASEAGISRSTASSHLRKLHEGGMIAVTEYGRNRYYRLASAQVAEVIEKLSELASEEPIRSLREGTKAAQLSLARTCYDHLAGRLGVSVMQSMLRQELLCGGDGTYHRLKSQADRPASAGRDHDYRLTPAGDDFIGSLGVKLVPGNRPLIRYCIDWTEQNHHLAGKLGRGLFECFLEQGWVAQRQSSRALKITPRGSEALLQHFGIDLLA
ncbi:ArsR/SmtB family transcription factor [Psychromicrobium lacuslunae]|uniref:ArsR family transcriptional regulator n=1 Tax=Psychromicrobium lacuslunae TaxID=1618207 RepID=A0A0D4BY51_9MICC|nr:helix-turn-helix domain-containing protein [Psychromicrobium lacuslunae]AJT41263.1 ArsR family transcriptional regulator [Psychromicrobium lacuslunae]